MSSVVVNLADYLDPPLSIEPLETSGGPGDFNGGMEARIAALEAHMEHVRSDLSTLKSDVGTLKTDMATMTERVSHLPTKGFIVTATLTTLAVLGALSLYGPNLRTFLGIH